MSLATGNSGCQADNSMAVCGSSRMGSRYGRFDADNEADWYKRVKLMQAAGAGSISGLGSG